MSYDKIIKEEYTGEVAVKKSKFIATLKPATTEEEAAKYISSLKKKYYDARHNCSCYIIGKGDIIKSSDDGEPSGTAGRPMLEVIKGEGLYDIVCVVTRYFGGVLLGTGGLVRAYQDAVKAALDKALLFKTVTVDVIEVISDYNNWAKAEQFLRSNNITIADIGYSDRIKAIIEVETDNTQAYIKTLTDITYAKMSMSILGQKESAVHN